MFGLRRRHEGPGWKELFGDIGRSAIDLLGAEVAGAREELSELARRGLAVAVVALVALGLAFWALGAAATAAIAGLSVWLPLWGAALVLFGVLAAAALGFGLVARARLRRLEGPGAILRRRVESHLEFWRDEVFGAAADEGDELDDVEDVAVDREAPPRSVADRGSRGRPPVSMAPPADDDFSGFQP